MEDLLVLVELFGLKVIDEQSDILSNYGGIPNIMVEGSWGPVEIRCLNGTFHTTGRIDGVPTSYVGNGLWQYQIDI